jgi:Kef-type K+ transport system membrane component KefB
MAAPHVGPDGIPQAFGALAVLLALAKLMGVSVSRIGQPAVLGELVAGLIVGISGLGLIDPGSETIHLFAEIGVMILLFLIGLETDLNLLVRVGFSSAAVAVIGVGLPFAMGYAACRFLGLDHLVAIVAGAALTATSVGITARVFSDLGRLHTPESQIVLGAAVIDDLLGLVILSMISGLAQGEQVGVGRMVMTTAAAFGFLLGMLLVGRFIIPPLFRRISRVRMRGLLGTSAVVLTFALAWLADRAGSAMILGAFAAGILLAGTPEAHEVERDVTALGHFFVPIFFVSVGAAVDLRTLNPIDPARRWTVLIGLVLIVVAVVGKWLAGYAPFWFRGRKSVIGVGMIPRGEVGLIFAQLGMASGVLDDGLFSAVTMMVLVTTFLAPPWLKYLLSKGPVDLASSQAEQEGIEDLVTRP